MRCGRTRVRCGGVRDEASRGSVRNGERQTVTHFVVVSGSARGQDIEKMLRDFGWSGAARFCGFYWRGGGEQGFFGFPPEPLFASLFKIRDSAVPGSLGLCDIA